jgi:putative ubiquitin-RnfH superfamily antitoxin RatB of RatAB toxin-antitoxin module
MGHINKMSHVNKVGSNNELSKAGNDQHNKEVSHHYKSAHADKMPHINIEIVYATPLNQLVIPLEILEPCTVEQAILQSGILQQYPEIQLENNKVGIFSKVVPLSTLLKDCDRVEIYRPLIIDPKQARLRRVISKPKKGS